MSWLQVTLSGKYDGSQTTFLHLAVSPSEVTPKAFPSFPNSTYHPISGILIEVAILPKVNIKRTLPVSCGICKRWKAFQGHLQNCITLDSTPKIKKELGKSNKSKKQWTLNAMQVQSLRNWPLEMLETLYLKDGFGIEVWWLILWFTGMLKEVVLCKIYNFSYFSEKKKERRTKKKDKYKKYETFTQDRW